MIIHERNIYKRRITRRRFHYQRGKDIGSGTFGTVYEVDVEGVKHAAKVFTYADGKLHFTTIREIKTMRAIKSPYVLDIKEIIVERGKIHLLLEYFPNDLYKIIGTENFTLVDIRKIFWQILKGVEAMHDMDFLHRDLKTANILIKKEPILNNKDNNSTFIEDDCKKSSTAINESFNDHNYSQDIQDATAMRQNKWAKIDPNTLNSEPKRFCIDGSKVTEEMKEEIKEDKEIEIPKNTSEDNHIINYEYKIKICDFGMSRHKSKVMTPGVTTLWYRAPELLLGATIYTKAVDVWSLGCILLEMFKQKPIIKSNTEVEALDAIVDLCGTISKETMPNCENLPLFSKYNLQKSERKILSNYKAYSPEAADLADKMLVLNPLERLTIKKCLEHPFFQNIKK